MAELFEFGDPPETVQENVSAMSSLMQQKRAAGEAIAAARDTERYLVVVFKDRSAREVALKTLGLPEDERYLAGSAVELRLREGKAMRDALVVGSRPLQAAPVTKSGSAG